VPALTQVGVLYPLRPGSSTTGAAEAGDGAEGGEDLTAVRPEKKRESLEKIHLDFCIVSRRTSREISQEGKKERGRQLQSLWERTGGSCRATQEKAKLEHKSGVRRLQFGQLKGVRMRRRRASKVDSEGVPSKGQAEKKLTGGVQRALSALRRRE